MLPSKTNNNGHALVNIENLRPSFEQHARKLFVVIGGLVNPPGTMNKKTVITRSGRRATAISTVINRSIDKLHLKVYNKENKSIVTHGAIIRKQIKRTPEIEITLQNVDPKATKQLNLTKSSSIVTTVIDGRRQIEKNNNTGAITQSIENISLKENNNCSINVQENEANEFIRRRCSPTKNRRNREGTLTNISTVDNKSKIIKAGKLSVAKNKNITTSTNSVKQNKCVHKFEDVGQDKFETKKTTRKDARITIENPDLVNEVPLKYASKVSHRRLRKRNLIYYNEFYQNEEHLKLKTITEHAKRIPIYRNVISDSENDSIKYKRDVYKFTEDIFNDSDANPYDKVTGEIMQRIKKAERNEIKRKLKAKENIRNKRKNKPTTKNQKNQFVEMEITSSNASTSKPRTYPSKNGVNTGIAQKNSQKIQILSDIVVHVPSNNVINLTTEKSLIQPISAFDKLKAATHLSAPPSEDEGNQDEVHEGFDSPEASVYVRNTTPFLQNANNTPFNYLSTSRQTVSYTSLIEPAYNLSNSYGFDDGKEENSPEQSILINLNEVSRKLQKRTPWRNRLVVKNKRILEVKSSCLPSVEQELILDSTIIGKLCKCPEKDITCEQKAQNEPVQTKLDFYLGKPTADIENANVNNANLSTLFDASNLSPIKRIAAHRKFLLETPVQSNSISTPKNSFRRDILESTNQQDPPDIIPTIKSTLQTRHSNKSDRAASGDLDNSYFGFITPANKKNSSKENVDALARNKSPSKLPMRFHSVDLRRFKKKYVSKKQREEKARTLEAKRRRQTEEKVCVLNNATNVEFEDENNVSDELPKLGLFDDLLQETEPREDHIKRKRTRKEDNEINERVCGSKKRSKKEMSEFDQWAKKFNKMCRKVEKHNLLIE